MCTWCGEEVGYTIGTSKGPIGTYYYTQCKNCGCTSCSEIMRVCNDNNGRDCDTEESLDGQFYVYSEEFVRRVIKEE